jgi:glycosyltransferase involved in cell wall biosynthesis
MVTHHEWDRRLGASRVQIDLAEELRGRGHVVDYFSLTEAFGRAPRNRLERELRWRFATAAERALNGRCGGYDVIDAHQGCLTVPKAELGSPGAVVVRSAGLNAFLERYRRWAARRWPDCKRKQPMRSVENLQSRIHARDCRRSYKVADAIVAINSDEYAYLSESGFGPKVFMVPNGLRRDHLQALSAGAAPISERHVGAEVAFIGRWSPSKGARDWREIAERVLEMAPRARFRFLGTGDERTVRADLGPRVERVSVVVERYRPDELPRLLASSTVGALPTYVEGFGLGALEQLAAGLPVVAYDVSGPRETIGRVSRDLLMPTGRTEKFAAALVAVISADLTEYERLCERSRCVAAGFVWDDLATTTEQVYRDAIRMASRAPTNRPAAGSVSGVSTHGVADDA